MGIEKKFRDCVAKRFGDAVIGSATKSGCSLCLRNCPDRVLIDLDQLPRDAGEKRGDLVVFAPQENTDLLKGVALELKSGKLGSVSRVLDQLQAALDEMSKILECCPTKIDPRAVVLCQRPDPAGIKALKSTKLTFKDTKLIARLERCGTNISKL